jgi:hypothetical protein
MALTAALAITPGAQAAGGPTDGVIFSLAPKSHAVLSALARSHNLTAQQRRAAIASVTPDAATRAAIVAEIQASGLHVTSSNTWTITASAPRSVLQAVLNATPTSRGLLLPNHPRVNSPLWARLGSAVDSIVAGDGRARLRPLSPGHQDGTKLQKLYKAEAKAPVTGQRSTVAVATLQFDGWDNSYLTSFAQQPTIVGGLGWAQDPVADGQYREVAVSDGQTTADPRAALDGGDLEVALDQETILAVAPYANQVAYFAPNTDAGEIAAINQVATDAATGKDNIVALSISWGLCEADMAPATMTAMSQAFQRVLAAGVTVFAASGDSGSWDCQGLTSSPPIVPFDPNAQYVDSPANDPLVIGVGGTTVDVNDSQTGWSCATIQDAIHGGCSGGGASTQFAVPGYQSGAGITGPHRQVPDIAADGDPASGMRIYFPGSMTNWTYVGGTSLASPVSAAGLANVLGIQNRTVGVGDIHSLLYSATAGLTLTSQIIDIQDGNNGFAAGLGYDNVTGLGAPRWSFLFPQADAVPNVSTVPATNNGYSKSHAIKFTAVLPTKAVASKWGAGADPTTPVPADCAALTATSVPSSVVVPTDGTYTLWVAERTARNVCNIVKQTVVVDTIRPTTTFSGALVSPTGSRATVTWKGKDPAGIFKVSAVARHLGGPGTDWSVSGKANVAAGSHTWNAVPGRTYLVTVTAYDKALNVSMPVVYKFTVPFDDTNFVLKGWTKVADAHAYFGTWSKSSSPAASATKTITGSALSVQYTACPACGRLGVYVNGALAKTVDTYSATAKYHASTVVFTGSRAARKVSVRPLGTKSAKSKGASVQFDGLIALP